MKYFLSVEFEDQETQTSYERGDAIAFIAMRTGLLKCGIIKDIKYSSWDPLAPKEYIVMCQGREFIAVADYVLKRNAKVLNLKTTIEENDHGYFPLRT